MNYIKRLYSGRVNRLQFLIGFVSGLIITLILMLLGDLVILLGNSNLSALAHLYLLLIIIVFTFFAYSLEVRRFHDMGYSGWLVLLTFIPLINLIYTLLLFLIPGKSFANKYGEVKGSKINVRKDLLALR